MSVPSETNEPTTVPILKDVQLPTNSQTASDYIDEQLALEADAKEILPYKFDKCTYPLGPLRQSVFACLTCSPPPASVAQVYTPAGVCYSCSISCHSDHTLVELFSRRNFVCDCGTKRMPSTAPCNVRLNSDTGKKGVTSQEPAIGNNYNQNFQNHFCGCGEDYNAETEKGTMYQCLGLGTVETGGCGEDWWHPQCLMGLPKDWHEKGLALAKPDKPEENGKVVEEGEREHPVPEGFPDDEDFATVICYKCVESNPWIKAYGGSSDFVPLAHKFEKARTDIEVDRSTEPASLKRKLSNDSDFDHRSSSPSKRVKNDIRDSLLEAEDTTTEDKPDEQGTSAALGVPSTGIVSKQKHDDLPAPPEGIFSLFMKKDFREKLCHCPKCFPNLIPHPQLQEEEDEYEPSISDTVESVVGAGSGTRSHATGSLLDRGEAALSTMDRVKAIEGVMAYNHLKDKVKAFLKPYAESGKPVGAEDIKEYFEKLRGDEAAIREASTRPIPDEEESNGDNRHEQSGY